MDITGATLEEDASSRTKKEKSFALIRGSQVSCFLCDDKSSYRGFLSALKHLLEGSSSSSTSSSSKPSKSQPKMEHPMQAQDEHLIAGDCISVTLACEKLPKMDGGLTGKSGRNI